MEHCNIVERFREKELLYTEISVQDKEAVVVLLEELEERWGKANHWTERKHIRSYHWILPGQHAVITIEKEKYADVVILPIANAMELENQSMNDTNN